MSSFNHYGCSFCGGPHNGGNCPGCSVIESGNRFVYDQNPYPYHETNDYFNQPPQQQYETYSCEFYGGNSHPGFDCQTGNTPVFDQGPCYNQDFGFNQPPHYSPSQPQQYLCCENCGGPHETFECQPLNQNFYNSNSFGFDQCQPPQSPVIHQPPQETSVEIFQAKEDLMISIETFLKKFNRISFRETPKVLLLVWEKFFEIKNREKQHSPEDIQELIRKLLEDVQNISKELVEYINSPSWNRPAFYFDDDNDEESSILVRDIISELPLCVAITPEDPDDSLSMGDEHLSTIPEMKSDKFIKSSIKNLVPTPSESEDECECDMPDCDDSQTTNFSTYSNPLFDDSTSSDEKSSHEEEIHEMSFITYSNPLFDIDEEIISSEFNPIHNEDPDSTLKNDRFDTESYLLESLINRDTLMASPPKIYFLLDEFADSTIDVVEDIPVDVPNILPTHPALLIDFDFIPSNDLGSNLEDSSLFGDRNKIYDPGICIEVKSTRFLAPLSLVIDTLFPFSSENKDKVFNHGVLATKEKSPPSSSHRDFKASKLFHQKCPMLIHGDNTSNLGVRHPHFYPP
ncbi:hypothetical protein Tco_0808449 [Tanacetum coccineum]